MPYRSNLGNATRQFQAARIAALIAAAEVLVFRLKEAHLGGHTSGAFVTGNEVASIVRMDPEPYDRGLLIRVTTRQTDPPYPWFWVTGHANRWTGKFERDDRWTPTLANSAQEIAATHARVLAQAMGG
jgi:hypothetical protein